jgi:hypothetical protein
MHTPARDSIRFSGMLSLNGKSLTTLTKEEMVEFISKGFKYEVRRGEEHVLVLTNVVFHHPKGGHLIHITAQIGSVDLEVARIHLKGNPEDLSWLDEGKEVDVTCHVAVCPLTYVYRRL